MAIELKIPSVGESISEVQIAEWLKADGAEVKKDENIAVLDSEKTTLELPAPESGRLKILHQAGDTVKIGEVVAQILTNGEAEKPPAAPKQSEGGKAETKPKAAPEKKVEPKKETPKHPTVVEAEKDTEEKAEAHEENVPQPEIRLKRQPKPGEKVVPMTMLRRTAARRLVEAKQQMAMLTTFNEVDMSTVQSLRKENQPEFEKRHGVKLGFMSFFVKAVVDGLKQFTQLNAEIHGNDIVYHSQFDIGVAIASDRGLVVPVLRDAEKMSFAAIEKAIADFAKSAKEGKLKPQELEGGTFTITNGGVFGSLLSTPIINPPQTGILGM
ncbi:MAG TPA: 2-oxo acid dehydrogenase subunit E2, partial [Candidatus Baltobacteraceae bacterium]|nr:2-oxo acid dehydrogenase subunit E2 [Candidatus Baltobacteraceae bacterium]